MKQKEHGKPFVLMAAVLMMTAVAVYAGGNKPDTSKRVTLEFMAPSPVAQVYDWDAVLNEVYKQTDSTLNVRINYVFTGFDDIGSKVSLRIAAGEQLDGAFVAQWTNPSMQQMISQGLLNNLDPYFNNDAYPGLKKYFPPDFLAGNKFTDARNESHVYAVPFTSNYGAGTEGFYYRKDLADKYGVGEINSYEKIIQYFEALKKNEPGMEPFATLDPVSTRILLPIYHTTPITSGHNALIDVSGTQVAVVVGDDGIAYASRHFIPAMDPKYRSLLKGPYKDEDPLLQYRLAKEWYDKGYVGKDILNEKDHEGKFIAGRAGSYNRAIDTYNFVLNRFKASLPNAELGVWIYSDTHRFNMSKVDGTGFNAWNFLGIPTTSKNIDRVMGFMEWIYNDRAHFDLLTYGIPGRHWIAVGNDKYDYPSGVNPAMNYDFHGYVLTWNTLLMRYPTDMPDFIVNAIVKAGDASAFYKRFDAGFSFVSDSVATEMAKLNDLLSYRRALEDGVVTNIEAEAARVQGLYEEAGFSKVATELERQINAFLKKNPYQGQ